jgi:hypothetical protein
MIWMQPLKQPAHMCLRGRMGLAWSNAKNAIAVSFLSEQNLLQIEPCRFD